MDTPNGQSIWPVKEVEPAKITPGSKAAKASIIAAVIVVGLNFAELMFFEERPARLATAKVAAVAVILAGLAAGAVGIIKAWGCTSKSMIPLAAAGLLLNGALIATGFVQLPIRGKLNEGPRGFSGKEFTENLPSGRRIITKDWTAGNVVGLTNTSFNEMINDSDMPVLVDFSASWCGACRAMRPAIEALAKEYEGKAKVCILNVDGARETASKFNISGIPTIILFKDGRVKKKWVGVTDSEEISSAINKLL